MSNDPSTPDGEPLEAPTTEPAPPVNAGAPPSPPPPPPGRPADPLFDEPGDAAPTRSGGATAAPSRKTLIGAGVGAAVIALGAVIGINLADSGAENATNASATGMPGAMQGGPGAASGTGGTTGATGAPGGMQGGPGGGTSGTVESVDGSTVTLSAQDGSSVEVTTDDDTVVAIAETGSADDVDEGDQVTVMGTADGDTIAAERVIDRGDATSTDTDGDGGPPGGMGGFASGEVSSADGDTFTVSTTDGDITVTMTDSTRIVVQTQGSIDDLESGDTVMVQGEAADDGSVAATRIIAGDLPQGGPGMGGQSGGMPGGPPTQDGSTGQVPAAPDGTTGSSGTDSDSTGSTGQPAGVTSTGGATTT